ncbi:MAG: dynamin family protein [Desulfobacteraceae bacterium]|nr:dynamin family protein [Desulfobacteraceae bacterium]
MSTNDPDDRREQAAQPRGALREYEKIKLDLADLVREVVAPAETGEQLREEGQELLARLAEDRFNVAVVGRFSRGKTSLMNAVLGTDRLPTGILPLTSVLTMVRYGSSEQALVYFGPRSLPLEIPLGQLAEYVTQEGNPGNRKGVAFVEVQLPSETLRRGFVFVDTPGLGSSIAASTAITTGFFPEMDAVIVVTSFEAALSAEEIEFLRQAMQGARKTFLVLNKLDLASGEERDRVRRYVEERLAEEAGAAGIGIFAVSARDGLAAKLENDASKLAKSGLPDFEQGLVHFMIAEKNVQVLALACRRLLELAARAGIPAGAPIPTKVREIQGVLQGYGAPKPAGTGTASPAGALGSAQVQLEQGCPVCGEVTARVFEFFCHSQYQLATSREARAAHVVAGGFCPRHTWHYEKIASPQGVCASYAVFLDAVAQRLRSLASKAVSVGDLASGFAGLAEAHPRCRACEEQKAAEEAALAKLVSRVTGSPGKLPLLCFLHLPPFLARLTDQQLARELIMHQAEACERISENMQRSVLKLDARRRALLSDEEQRAHLDGLMILSGDRQIAAGGMG